MRTCGALAVAWRAATVLIVAGGLLAAGLLAGGRDYVSGFTLTTLARVPGSASPAAVLADSWRWAGLLVILAALGTIISAVGRQPAAETLLLAVLLAAALAGPLNQARLHTAAVLDQHVGLGAWFAAIAAGYAVSRFIATAPPGRARTFTSGACVIALVFPVQLGASQSQALSTSWANATAFIKIFGPLADHGTGHLLVEDPSTAEYYLSAGSQWQRWSSTRNILLPGGTSTGGPDAAAGLTGAGNAGVFAEFITSGYFSLVALNYADTGALDRSITADLRRNHYYRIVQVIPYGIEVPPIGQGTYVVWEYQPRARSGRCADSPVACGRTRLGA